MLYAAIETSTRTPSVAVKHDSDVRVVHLAGERPHASDLLPALARLLEELDARPDTLEAIVVGTGPGSYTGLRVGIATALGLARGSGARLYGLPSGEALVWEHLRAGERASILLDARREELYFARYERTASDIVTLTAPCILAPGKVSLEADEVVFSEPELDVSAITGVNASVRTDVIPSAAAALELGLARLERDGEHAPHELDPLYLRAFSKR